MDQDPDTESYEGAPRAGSQTEHGRQRGHGLSKSRKSASAPSAPTASQQAFHFVDGSSSKEKRAHVMRHHLKEKGKLKRENLDNKRGGRSVRYLPWTRKSDSSPGDQGAVVSQPGESGGSSAGTGSPSEPARATQNTINGPIPLDASNSLLTRLSASRKDPFDCLPLALQNDDHELVAYWTSRLAYWSGENTYMKDIVFRRAMQNPLTFQVVILTYCARYRDHCYGVIESPESSHHIAQARRYLDDYIQTADDPEDDNVAMAVTALSLQDERYGSRKAAVRDIESARHMMRSRIGRINVAETFLHYVYYLTGPPERPKGHGVVYPLIKFLRLAERLMVEHKSIPFLAQIPERQRLFEIGTSLHQLLSSGPRPTQVSPEKHKWVLKYHPITESCRTAALLYITMALYDCQGSAEKCRRFLKHLTTIIFEQKLDGVPAVESFTWFLIEERWKVEDMDLRNPARPMAVGDALKNLKLLGPELQFHYTEALLGLVMLTTPITSLRAFEKGINQADAEGE